MFRPGTSVPAWNGYAAAGCPYDPVHIFLCLRLIHFIPMYSQHWSRVTQWMLFHFPASRLTWYQNCHVSRSTVFSVVMRGDAPHMVKSKSGRRSSMRRKYKEITKDTIVSARISDDEMKSVKLLMEVTNLSAAEIMRKAFHLQVARFNEVGALGSSCL
jgi:hypothetical protein